MPFSLRLEYKKLPPKVPLGSLAWIWLTVPCALDPHCGSLASLISHRAHLAHSHVTQVSLELRFQDNGEGTVSGSYDLDEELTFTLSALSLLGGVGQSWWGGGRDG